MIYETINKPLQHRSVIQKYQQQRAGTRAILRSFVIAAFTLAGLDY